MGRIEKTFAQQRELKWLFLDLNSYFASVEQELWPELRHKPVGVVPVMTDSTCCIAASYEAKARGVKTGTMVREARELCPDIQFVEAQHQVYVEFHHKIVRAVESCVPVSVVLSVDEMACRLIGREREIEKAQEIAERAKQAIRDQVGRTLRCSVGLAPNRFLAKVGSEMEKPNGLVTILPGELPDILFDLELRDLPGVGRRMHERLLKNGVNSVERLCALSKREMRRIWGGIVGERFWLWLRGEDFEEEPTRRQTIGHSHVLPPDLRTHEGAYQVAQKLVHKAGARLRKMGFWANRMSLSLSSGREWQGWKKDVTMVECQDTLTLLEALNKLWQKRPETPPSAVGVTLFDLIPDEVHTLDLFSDPKREKLSSAIDKINEKFGSNTIYFGGVHHAKHAAPTRIAFTSIPDYF